MKWHHLERHLDPLAQRQRKLRTWRALTACWVAGILMTVSLWALDINSWATLPVLVGVMTIVVVWAVRRANEWQPDYRDLARRIERDNPDLHAVLLTALEQEPDPKTGELNFLQQRVINEALAEALKGQWIESVPATRLAGAAALQCVALIAMATASTQLVPINVAAAGTKPSNAEKPGGSNPGASPAKLAKVEPGDTEVERGSSLAFLAEFVERTPPDAQLITQPAKGKARSINMARNLQDPIFGATLPEVNQPLTYWVEFGKSKSKAYKVGVYEHPQLESADAKLTYPTYTGREPREQKDVRRLTAVAGTQLEYTMHLNKPVAQARLVAADDSVIELKVAPKEPVALLPGHVLSKPGRYRLKLVDTAKRQNKFPPLFEFNVLPNLPPKIVDLGPLDLTPNPQEEIDLKFKVEDDFGVTSAGVTIISPNGKQDIVLIEDPLVEEYRNWYALSILAKAKHDDKKLAEKRIRVLKKKMNQDQIERAEDEVKEFLGGEK
jgi:hypothetical protein